MKNKKIKIIPTKGKKILHIVKGKKEWNFTGDFPIEVDQEDYENYLSKEFEVYPEKSQKKEKEVKNG